MRLQHKLLVINIGVAALAAAAFWLAFASARSAGEACVRVSEQSLPAVRHLEQVRAAALQVLTAADKAALAAFLGSFSGADAAWVRAMRAPEAAELRLSMAALDDSAARHQGMVERVPGDGGSGGDPLARELGEAVRTMLRASGEFLARLDEPRAGPELLTARRRLESHARALLASATAALDHAGAELAGRKAHAAGAIEASGRAVAFASLLVLLLMAAAAYAVARTIVRPIGRLTEAAARIAAGETARVDPPRSRDEIGRLFAAFRGMAEDLSASQARAHHLALHDALTGLPNRVLLAERLTQEVARARRGGGAVAVLCLDLDRFKEVNDTLGHGAGDLLLRQMAERLRACLRETDTVARLGGDEFAIVQAGAQQPTDAEALCRRLSESLSAPFPLDDGQEVAVGVSTGVALAPVDGDEPEALLRHADIALYRAKADGRGTFRFFEEGMNAQLQARKALERDLRGALAEGQLALHYQPLIELRTGRLTGAEALLRWRHPERGDVPPGEFIGVAEDTGLIVPIGEWVLRAACAQAAPWTPLKIAVNLSPVQFRQRDLAEVVARVLRETGLEPDRLELEITEGVLLEDTEAALATLQALKRQGVRLAMDDFGTGYSSLSYLRRFPFDKIKVDRSFVADLGRSAGAAAIVRSVVGLGSSLGMTTNAEGVEAGEQAEILLAEGCDEVQGYYFGRPVAPAEFALLLAAGGRPASGGAGRHPRPAAA